MTGFEGNPAIGRKKCGREGTNDASRLSVKKY